MHWLKFWWPTIALWLVILAAGTWLMQGLLARQANPNREARMQDGQLQLQRARDGHFRLNGTINGHPVRFLVDTGASSVALDARLAEQIGLKRGIPIRMATANGETDGYATRIDELMLGDLRLQDVNASVAPNFSDADEVLLGMSALKRLNITLDGERMVLRPRAP